MFLNLKHDYKRLYNKTSYTGRIRKFLIVCGSQGFQAVMGYRVCRWLVQRRIPFLHFIIQRFIEITTGISIPPVAKIGKGLVVMHFGGIIIHPTCQIGDYCTITHGVTIGNKEPGGQSPVIGNNVYICAGAKVLGDITVGDNCIIGANAVLTKSIPPDSVVAGIPAKVIKKVKNKDDYKGFFSHEN